MTTATADADQMIVTPHLDTKQGAWAGTKWGTENSTEWSCAFTTDTITTVSYTAGLKLTNTATYATDANQAYFLFCTDDDLGALTTNAIVTTAM